MHRTLIVFPLLALVSLFAQEAPRAQQSTDFKGVVLKNKAPVSNEILKVKFVRPVESKLKNGMQLMVLEDHRSPTVQIQFSLPASSMNDPEGVPISGATTSLMRLGTKTRSAKQIAETLAELGANINFGIGDRSATVNFSTLSENSDAVMELAADMLFNPAFPEDELAKWKNQQLAQLQQVRAIPDFLATERFAYAMYPTDRRSLVFPSMEGINKITRDMVVEHYNRVFRPEGGRITVLGDSSTKQIAPKLEKFIGTWKGAAPKPPELPMLTPAVGRKIILVNRANSVQTVLYLGEHAIDRLSPDYIPVQVLNRILGGGPASRLFRNVREEKGYTYGISSGFTASRYMNHFSTQTSVRTEVTGDALTEILKEFADIRDRRVPADELEGAKRALVATFALNSENPGAAMQNATQIKEYGFPADYWDTYPEKIAAVTAEDIQRVARKYIPLENIQIIVVGDATKIRSVLDKFGPIEEWDADGKKLN
jgi:predicted Zn-dependent peptidase